jgi:hypothetical protein
MTGSGLAAQPSQSLENIARGTRRSMGQFIPQYRTARSAHEIMVGDPPEAVERESWGLWGKTGQRSLERSACLALLVRKPATKVRFWPEAHGLAAGSNVRFRGEADTPLECAPDGGQF